MNAGARDLGVLVFRETAVPKNEDKARAGHLGARARWRGERRIVRLDTLAAPVAAAIRALVEADQDMKKAAAISKTPATAEPEVQANARPAA